ncbi:M23 family metallopeptidase [Ornithinimicrobium kibberense]|uniref:M23 family metallopeptidase n=1 Tax=Ornithinimicrobium kibberense TaxID=282060 RepID=A0ABV5UYY2_9MICO|nr:M23 family metallopeptidase [Ornithinimicrobium kibberense]
MRRHGPAASALCALLVAVLPPPAGGVPTDEPVPPPPAPGVAAPADGAWTTSPPGDAVLAGPRDRRPPWEWPTVTVRAVARPFDPPARRWLPGHRGVDLVGVLGEPVRAVDDGVVSFSGTIAGVGVVSLTHADGLRSTYQPVSPSVAAGVTVARGQQIGDLDAGGHCLLLHCLHLGAVRGRDSYLDPALLLGQVRLTLLPSSGTAG